MTFIEEQIAFYYEIGRAWAAWTTLEGTLLHLVRLCVDEELGKNSMGMGFVSIQGFRNKLNFTTEALRRRLAGTQHDIAEWEGIAEHLLKASYKRNDLAHYVTAPFEKNEPGRRMAITPWSKPKGWDDDKPPPESYCLLNIVSMRLEFSAHIAKVGNYLCRITGAPEQFPKSDEQPGNPPTIEQIRRQIHAELGHPQKSAREKRMEESAKNAEASLKIVLPKEK